jgi:hypothetical protein
MLATGEEINPGNTPFSIEVSLHFFKWKMADNRLNMIVSLLK